MRPFLFAFVLVLSVFLSHADDLQDRLLVYLPLAENFDDASTNRVPLTVLGETKITSQGAVFSGPEDGLLLPHFALDRRPFAVAMWVKVTGRNPMYGLLYQHDSSENNHWLHLMFRGGLQPYLGFYNNDAISPLAVPQNQWVHLVFQFDGHNQQLWVNAGLLCSRQSTPYEGTQGRTYIGRSPNWNNVPSKTFEGSIREFRLYERALRGSEIRALVGLQDDLRIASEALLTDPLLSNALAADVGIPFLEISGNKLLITGESKQIYELHAASDLNTDFQFLTLLTNLTGRVEYSDSTASPNRFYSVKLHK
jgi:hypothetical protein